MFTMEVLREVLIKNGDMLNISETLSAVSY